MLEAAAPWYSEPHVQLWQGDCRTIMAQMPAESVDCVVFSPPFLGLRVYDGVQSVPWADGQNCAWGLEPSVDGPQGWVAHTLEVMQAVKRVLKPSGVAWLEIADSYAGSTGNNRGTMDWRTGGSPAPSETTVQRGRIIQGSGLKPKDLCLVPERLALALQDSGWWVRSRIVWAKPNPMPESVIDRPTKSHSTIWMLTKAASYYWDSEAVRVEGPSYTRQASGYSSSQYLNTHLLGKQGAFSSRTVETSGRNLRDVWEFPTSPFGYELCQSCGQIYTAAQFMRLAVKGKSHGPGKYWDYETAEYTEDFGKVCRCGASDFLSHFATFPEALPTRCILASTSEAGCCPKCGKPWERVIERTGHINKREPAHVPNHSDTKVDSTGWAPTTKATDTWRPGCSCGLPQAENVPCTVLDVCSGSGTSVVAAKKLGRRAVGIDLSAKYLALARRRLEAVPMSLGGIT